MSTSCVCRSVCRRNSRTAAYPTDVPPAQPLEPRELDALRDDADRFDAELMEEYYLHYAGLKETLELEAIYARHADLTRVETAQRVGASVDGDRRRRELWRFVSDGYLSALTREHEERAAALEAELEIGRASCRERGEVSVGAVSL